MKKALVAKLALAGTVGLAGAMAAGTAFAGPCSNCHTMHNSQDGNPMNFDSAATPNPILLRGDCYYCHQGLNTTGSLLNSPPKVYGEAGLVEQTTTNSATDNRALAAGDFFWVEGNDAFGHNVGNFGTAMAADVLLSTAPGGTQTAQVRCAGANGCHGDTSAGLTGDPIGAMAGAHHAVHNTLSNSAAELDGTTTGKSYRFLMGVVGLEDSDWQHSESTTDHNQYAGESRTAATTSAQSALAGGNRTISALCASCHGAFHNTVDGSGADTFGINTTNSNFATGQWIRHPTDYDMTEGGLTDEFDSYNSYNIIAPVGRSAALSSANNGTVTGAGYRIVLCVSCHRAHGSPYSDALRWSYGEMQVGTTGSAAGTGCFACHAFKDGV